MNIFTTVNPTVNFGKGTLSLTYGITFDWFWVLRKSKKRREFNSYYELRIDVT